MNTPPEASRPTVEDFLDPKPETLVALGDALHGLHEYAAEGRPLALGGREFVHSNVDETFNDGTTVQASWLEGGEASSLAELREEYMITHVHLESDEVRVNYSLSSSGKSRLIILKPGEAFSEGTGDKPPGTNKPTENGIKTLTDAINNALESGLSKENESN